MSMNFTGSCLLEHPLRFIPDGALRYPQKGAKSRFSEVLVCGQGFFDVQFTHDDKTGAIGEGITVIRVLAEESFGKIESRRANPFDTDAGALVDQVENPPGHKSTAAYLGHINRLGNHIIR